MNFNQPTTYVDLNGGSEESLDSMEMMDSSDSLSAAYTDLGKAFYEYRFEEPTPELLLYFDRITELLKTNKDLKRQRNEHIEPMVQPTHEQPSFIESTSPNLLQSLRTSSSNLEASQQADSKNSSNEREFDPWNQNSSNNFNNPSSEKEPEDLENKFFNKDYNQSSLESQQTSTDQSQSEPFSQYHTEKKKKGGFSPFPKKEKGRISSFDELPDMTKGKNKFSTQSESMATQAKYCPACHSPVGYSDDYCGNCGTRLNH